MLNYKYIFRRKLRRFIGSCDNTNNRNIKCSPQTRKISKKWNDGTCFYCNFGWLDLHFQ